MKKSRLFIVLGMHRSGTSAITRGLEVFGIDLGDRLIPSIEGNNAKGFWEDIDLNAFDNEMLAALGQDWSSLSPLTPADAATLRKQGFFLRAVELMRDKVGNAPLFGFKDPRVARLLPFWRDVFNHCGFEVSYIFALRHPLSVARSLAKRDGLEAEQSYLLWLGHVIPGLVNRAGAPTVVVDYDLLMQAPRQQLARVADAIGLTLDAAALVPYENEFLDAALRHSMYAADDLLLDEACPGLVYDVYATLLEVACDHQQLDAPALQEKIAQWAHDYAMLTPSLQLADKLLTKHAAVSALALTHDQSATALQQALSAGQAQLQSLGQTLAERDAQILELHLKVGERDAQLSNVGHVVAERDAQIVGLHYKVAERDAQLAGIGQLAAERAEQERVQQMQANSVHRDAAEIERDGLVAEVAQRDERIGALEQLLATREAVEAASATHKTQEHEEQVAHLQAQLAALNSQLDQRNASLADLNQQLADSQAKLSINSLEGGGRQVQLDELARNLTERRIRLRTEQRRNIQLDADLKEAQLRNAGYACHVQQLEQAVGDAHLQNSDLQLALATLQHEKNLLDLQERAVRHHLEQLLASRTWRMGAPVRALSTAARKARRGLFSAAVAVYRVLPLSGAVRRRVNDGLFTSFGFALRRTISYQQWQQAEQARKTSEASAGSVESALLVPVLPDCADVRDAEPGVAPAKPAQLLINPPLPVADGVWEWADYGNVKQRIAAAKATRLASVAVQPFELIELDADQLRAAAADVLLPKPPARPLVSIIVPAYNQVAFTLECLLSIAMHAEPAITFEVIVADDASSDETAELMQSIEHLRYVRNERNLGFLANCNEALTHVNGTYVLYLNNDVQVTAGWLSALLATFDAHPNVGAVGPRFVYPGGHLQEAGVAFTPDGAAMMIGLNDDPQQPQYSYQRRVDYVSGACLLLKTELARKLGGFSEEFLPCYCEDADLCLSVRDAGYDIWYNPDATLIHHLSKTTASDNSDFKMRCITNNLTTLQTKWSAALDRDMIPKLIAFFLPQYHPVQENDQWWGKGFTEWTNVSKTQPNFVGHYQPRVPADLGYYDLRLIEVMQQQAALAQRYGVHGFCYYYYWFDGKRLLERPVEQLLLSAEPALPFCLCWANENWTRRWDGQDNEVLMAQSHTVEDDLAVIADLMRFFRDARYIRIDGKPLLVIYRVTLFPDFAATAARWRAACREQGIGEIYIAMVESFDLVHTATPPSAFGCDAAIEFPPQGMAEQRPPSGELLNPDFAGHTADYRDLAVRYATRPQPAYTRFRGVMPGWDNSARRKNNSFCFEHASPGVFQAWLEESLDQTRAEQFGDERLVFVNAWNEWAEGAYLEPDRRYGHTYLEAVANARDAARLLKKNGSGV